MCRVGITFGDVVDRVYTVEESVDHLWVELLPTNRRGDEGRQLLPFTYDAAIVPALSPFVNYRDPLLTDLSIDSMKLF